MATVIRFARHGSKKRPFYRIVVQTKTAPRDGRFIENIGTYNPLKGLPSLTVARERLEYWLGTGAIMSDSVKNRLSDLRKSWATAGASVGAEAPAAAPKAAKPKAEKKPAAKKAKASAEK